MIAVGRKNLKINLCYSNRKESKRTRLVKVKVLPLVHNSIENKLNFPRHVFVIVQIHSDSMLVLTIDFLRRILELIESK